MKYLKLITLAILLAAGFSHSAEAQLFGKKKKKKSGVTPQLTLKQAPSPEEQKKAMERQLVSPVRKFLNGFNLHIEKSFGYFEYKSELSDLSVVRDPTGSLLYIVPLGQEQEGTTPINAYSNWHTDLTSVNINRIDDDSQIVRTDTVNFAYTNQGTLNPWVFRLDYTFKKVDKEKSKATGEKHYLEEDLFRIGAGIGFGKINYRNGVHQQEVEPLLRNYALDRTEISTTKIFGSLSYNAYSIGTLSIIPDVYGGVWKTKKEQINREVATMDPFFNIGVMFEHTWSKYFKGYIRPAVEFRSYTVANDMVSVQHKYTIFSIDIGLLLKYPTYPRNKFKAHMVQMEHVFNGKMYRGRPFYRPQNPRTGQNRRTKRGTGYSFPKRKN